MKTHRKSIFLSISIIIFTKICKSIDYKDFILRNVHPAKFLDIVFHNNIKNIDHDAFNTVFDSKAQPMKLILPDTLEEIGADAFRNVMIDMQYGLRLGSNIKTIGSYAFYYGSTGYYSQSNDGRTDIYIKSKTPPTLTSYSTSFAFVWYLDPLGTSTRTDRFFNNIYVPTESLETYKSADGWKRYSSYIKGYNFED